MRISDWSSDVCSSDLNDAVLGMCAGAMRKYLQSLNELPDKPLKAMAPVSIRPKDDVDSGNSVASVTANLATHIDDPATRMAMIQESMNSAKAQLREMTAAQIQLYTAITSFPMMQRSEEHTSALPSLMRLSYAV